MRVVRLTFAVLILTGLVAACGVRGKTEPPPGSTPPDKDKPFILDPVIE
ncbi:hypothetical protein BH10PSE7_BH10PSE7_32130 [soil metagenome]